MRNNEYIIGKNNQPGALVGWAANAVKGLDEAYLILGGSLWLSGL